MRGSSSTHRTRIESGLFITKPPGTCSSPLRVASPPASRTGHSPTSDTRHPLRTPALIVRGKSRHRRCRTAILQWRPPRAHRTATERPGPEHGGRLLPPPAQREDPTARAGRPRAARAKRRGYAPPPPAEATRRRLQAADTAAAPPGVHGPGSSTRYRAEALQPKRRRRAACPSPTTVLLPLPSWHAVAAPRVAR